MVKRMDDRVIRYMTGDKLIFIQVLIKGIRPLKPIKCHKSVTASYPRLDCVYNTRNKLQLLPSNIQMASCLQLQNMTFAI